MALFASCRVTLILQHPLFRDSFFFVTAQGVEQFLAVDEGVLIKCGGEVLVSTRNAVIGPDLGMLKQTIQKRFVELDDREKISRSALAKLEANFVRRFMELKKPG